MRFLIFILSVFSINTFGQSLGFFMSTAKPQQEQFNILEVPGIRFLFDGDNAQLSSANVESITNQVSGEADAVKLADGSRPTIVDNDLNGHKTIDFSGAQALKINVTDIKATDMTWFVVFKTDGTSGSSRRPMLNCSSGSSGGFSVNIVNNTIEFFIRSSTAQAFTDTEDWHVMMVKAKHYGASRSMRVFKVDNGTPVNSVTSAFSDLSLNLFIGTNNDQSLFYDGRIAEVIGFEDVVTEDYEKRIYEYLNSKYGLSIPTTMPEYAFNTGSLTYNSTWDDLSDLNYTVSISGKTFGKQAPILVLQHGYFDVASSFTTTVRARLANLGFVCVVPSMRGRDGGDGRMDSSGRELLDILDAINKLISDYPDLVYEDRTHLWGGSGGGGNAIGCAAKFPDRFGVIVDAFGMTDYIFDEETSWYAQANPSGTVNDSLEVSILGAVDRDPSDYPNHAKSRDHRYSAIYNFQGIGHIIHDEQDTAVPIEHSDELWKQVIDQDKTGQWSIHGSGTSNSTRLSGEYEYPVQNTYRYNHGYPGNDNPGLIQSEDYWKNQALTLSRPEPKLSGTFRVSGYLVTQKFKIFLGLTEADGLSCEADLEFDYDRNEYTITPIFHGEATEMAYYFEDDQGNFEGGTITAETAFTPSSQIYTIESVESLTPINVDYGTPFELLDLPETITATLTPGGGEIEVDITWEPGDYDGETADTYELTGNLGGLPLYVSNPEQITASIDVTVEEDPGANDPPVIDGKPSITGTAIVPNTLTAIPATVSGGGVVNTWQWKRDGSNIGGATSITYTLTSSDYDTDITVVQTSTNDFGSDDAESDPVAIAASSPGPEDGVLVEKRLGAGSGAPKGFLQWLPDDYSTTTKGYATIIFLHGHGERGNGTTQLNLVDNNGIPLKIAQGWNATVDTAKFIVLCPQQSTAYNGWIGNPNDPIPNDALEFCLWALNDSGLRIDPDRLYLTGLSMGTPWYAAGFSGNINGTPYENIFAAIAPVSTIGEWIDGQRVGNRDIPVWAFHGSADTSIPLSDGQRPINGFNNVGGTPTPIMTVYSGLGHSGAVWNTRAYATDHTYHNPNLYEWFLTKTKP